MTASSAVFVCRNAAYCPTPEYFDTVSAFQAMCSDRFGVAPALTSLPLDFPGLEAEARRLAQELYELLSLTCEEVYGHRLRGWNTLTTQEQEPHVRAQARLLAALTRPESQCFWLQALAIKLNKPVFPCSPPRLSRDSFRSAQSSRELYWFSRTGPDGWMMGFHDSPFPVKASEWDFRVPGINQVPPTPDGANEVLRLALCAAYGVTP